MWLKERKSNTTSPDITPLVDLVFLLIIFFLLSTTFRVSPGIRIDLPTASSQKIVQEKNEITLSVDQAGKIYVDKDRVEPEQLSHRLMVVAHKDRNTTVLIKGDRGAGFGRVVDVLGTVKDSGLHRIAIMTQRKKGEQQEQVGASRQKE
jgi:biopolymer transport protein ExbD